jgi:hypothetical protein
MKANESLENCEFVRETKRKRGSEWSDLERVFRFHFYLGNLADFKFKIQ